jgi:23S rRNA (adenine1618-N6)-methyltransferase
MPIANKPSLHARNPHQGRYPIDALCQKSPELTQYIKQNPRGEKTIDFSDPQAVKALNQAIIAHYYQVKHWHIPEGYLCPPIPGRADYIHYLADLLADEKGHIPQGKNISVLDIGTGANLIYPIIGSQSYGWRFVGTDIDPVSIATGQMIVKSNPCLNGKIQLRQQANPNKIFDSIIQPNDYFDLSMCNPPFHASADAANKANQRKRTNLAKKTDATTNKDPLNFGGKNAELWCTGGELAFIKKMIKESLNYTEQVGWFSSLVSKRENISALKKELNRVNAQEVRVISMAQGQKVSRLLVWRF